MGKRWEPTCVLAAICSICVARLTSTEVMLFAGDSSKKKFSAVWQTAITLAQRPQRPLYEKKWSPSGQKLKTQVFPETSKLLDATLA